MFEDYDDTAEKERLRLGHEAAVARYRDVINRRVKQVWRHHVFAGEYLPEELRAMAEDVAADRAALWDAKEVPPGHDLVLHMRNRIREERYDRGWRQRVDKDTGKRVWVRDGCPFPSDLLDTLGDTTWEPQRVLFGEDEGATYSLMADWPAFTPAERRQYARYMEMRYPEVCAAFEALDQEAKPPRLPWARWRRNREIARARLRVVHAQALAEARFAVTYGGIGLAA